MSRYEIITWAIFAELCEDQGLGEAEAWREAKARARHITKAR